MNSNIIPVVLNRLRFYNRAIGHVLLTSFNQLAVLPLIRPDLKYSIVHDDCEAAATYWLIKIVKPSNMENIIIVLAKLNLNSSLAWIPVFVHMKAFSEMTRIPDQLLAAFCFYWYSRLDSEPTLVFTLKPKSRYFFHTLTINLKITHL